MFQNATPLRKSAPRDPNISDEHVSCIVPATENASLQILFKCPTLAIVFGNATKPSRSAHFWQGAQSRAPATRNDIWTSKSAPNPSVFYTFGFDMCFAPEQRALFRHHNFQKVVWTWFVLYILTWKRAWRHNGVQFFISHLASWLGQLTFRPSGSINRLENSVSRPSYLSFRAPGSSFFWNFLFFWSSFFFSSLLWLFPSLLFICPYCRKFDF